jgi:hypothetical protein
VNLKQCLPELSSRGLLPAEYDSVVVVGSTARGWANQGSDFDAYVIVSEPWDGPRTVESHLPVKPGTVPIAVDHVNGRRWEIKYYLVSQIDQVLAKVTDTDGLPADELTQPERMLVIRLAHAVPLAGGELLAVWQRRIHGSRFRSSLVAQALEFFDSFAEDAVGALDDGQWETAVVAAKLAFEHVVEAVLGSHAQYDGRKWRGRMMRDLDPKQLPFDEYWSIETMRDFDPTAPRAWVERVLLTGQRICEEVEL